MPKANKGITDKIVDFLREKGGEAEIGLIGAGREFDCHPGTVSHVLDRLIKYEVIKRTAEPDLTGAKRPARYALNERFKEDDSWREALKRKSSGGKSQAGPSIVPQSSRQSPETGMHDEKCLEIRKALLEELADVYGKLKTCQEEKRALCDENKNLQERIRKLEEGADKKAEANRQLKQNVQELEERVKKLRVQTSQAPATGRSLRFDSFGAVILPGEERPDRS